MYPCTRGINIHWNTGILLGSMIYIQVFTGILLGLHYTPGIYTAYYSVMHIYREVYSGSLHRYMHSQVASPVSTGLLIHTSRGIFHGSWYSANQVGGTGIGVSVGLGAMAFMGYILPWGQMSYWGATVITNLLAGVPSLVPWILGGYHIHNPTISRYSTVHSSLPVHVTGTLVFHVLYLHGLSSSAIHVQCTNNRIHLYTWLLYKDTWALVAGGLTITVQVCGGAIGLAHTDNTLEASVLVTPLHIVPEWYFLYLYGILKSIPGRASGFLVMISYIYVLNTHGEPYSTGSLVECTGYTGRHWMGLLLLVLVYYSLGVGVQLPVGKYISYSRGYLVVSIWCKVGYLVGAVPVAVCLYAHYTPTNY
jgi:ubiquinol-cytochrome c reductase cytochrome b subunit